MSKLRGLGKRKPEEFCSWMDGYCEEFDNLSDGAWQSCCENAVEAYNEDHQTRIDSHDGWIFWIQNRAMKAKP